MVATKFSIPYLLYSFLTFVLLSVEEISATPMEIPSLVTDRGSGTGRIPVAYKKAPSIPTAPLDPNENIHHTLDEVNQILGSVGGAAGGLVMGLTGISITDCAQSIKGEDLSSLTCAQFIDKISECDSLSNIKPLLQQAKQKYKKKPNSNAPCFQNNRRGRKGQRRS